MEIKRYSYPLTDFQPACPYLSEHSLLLDIETTGFSNERESIYLIGTAYRTDDKITATLYFAESPDEESIILKHFCNDLLGFTQLITFNGDRFDLPFLRKRMNKHELNPDCLSKTISTDLLKSIQKNKKLLHLEHCNQKAIEEFLDIKRIDSLDGGELIPIYRHYSKYPNAADRQLLFQHNHDDIIGMLSLLPMLAYENLRSSALSLIRTDWDWEENLLMATFKAEVAVPKPIHIHEHTLHMIAEKNTLKTAIPIHRGTLRYYFPSPAKYVYLTRENTVIPKTLAAAIPSAEKRPAKQEECYVTASGDFVGFDSNLFCNNKRFFRSTKTFLKGWGEKTIYIKTDPIVTQPDKLCDYMSLLLSYYIQ